MENIIDNPENPELNSPTGAQNQPEQPDNKIPYDRFKQKVDEANELKRKLAEIETAQAESERKKLAEQNEFKTLYEQAQAEITRIQGEALTAKKDALLTKAGYSDEQVALLRATLSGTTDEELAQSVEVLKAAITPKTAGYIHQSPMGGTGGSDNRPPAKSPTSKGKELYDRVMKNKNK